MGGRARVLVTEKLAPAGLERLAAGDDLVVVGRVGIGLDNVEVGAATRREVMVVNARASQVMPLRAWPSPCGLDRKQTRPPPDVSAAAAGLQSHTTSNVANVSQRAALAAVSGSLDDVVRMREAFDRRRLRMFELLSALPGVTCLPPEGAFYAYPSFEGVLGRQIAGRQVDSTLELAEVILEEAKVALVPGEAFGAPGYARLSFALGDDDLEEGMARLAKLLS